MTAETADRTRYYYNRGQRVELEPDPTVFAVAYGPAGRIDEGVLGVVARRLLAEDSESVTFIAHYNLHVHALLPESMGGAVEDRLAGGEETARAFPLEQRLRALREEPGIAFAAAAVRRSQADGDVSFVTPRFVAAFKSNVTRAQIDELNARNGVRILEPLGYAPNGFLLSAPDAEGPTGSVAIANLYFETGLCEFAHADFIERRYWRTTTATRDEKKTTTRNESAAAFRGEFLAQQWHLPLAKVTDAWAITSGDASVTIAILDDGVDVGHPEFAGKLGPQFDFQTHAADGRPKSSDDMHGTSCAGVATAGGVKAHGVAPLCRLMAVRTPMILGVADEAAMFRWAADNGADVISCSWGPPDGKGPFALVDNVRAAIRYCCGSGRGGKGIPIFFAAGNGSESISNDGYAINPDVMAVAASSNRDRHSPYSDFGPEVFICAPSSGDTAAGDARIFTTDRIGVDGYNTLAPQRGDAAGNYFSGFGGTSSACPLVAGVVGLMLSVNPNLTRDQVREILKTTTDKIGGAAAYDGQGHNAQFGYGRINALQAVRAAQNFPSNGTVAGNAQPSIVGPTSASPNAPPTFTLSLGGRQLFAVELATNRDLLDPANAAQRTSSNHYGSWETGLSSGTTFVPPAAVWSALAQTGEVFYVAHFADDSNWSNYAASASPSQAPAIATGAGGGVPTPTGGVRSVSVPASGTVGSPATFQVALGPSRLYAIEIASDPTLFDSANAGRRTPENHYGSWVEGLSDTPTYSPPASVWSSIARAGRVYYLGHFADDPQWGGYVASDPLDRLRSIGITDAGVGGGGGGGVGGGSAEASSAAATEVRYPSGAVFGVVTDPQDNVDYSDRVANGLVPLIEVRGRASERLSTHFTVGELMAPNLRYARISPDLVEAIEAVRNQLNQPLKVESGYRCPALNEQLQGSPTSEHLSGRAATLRSPTNAIEPLEIARVALETIDVDFGLGLGRTTVHVNRAGRKDFFAYEDAAMTTEQFRAWAEGIVSSRGERKDRGVVELTDRMRPTIDGPRVVTRQGPAPTFRITSPVNRYVAIEITSETAFFDSRPRWIRPDTAFYATWQDPSVGLLEVGPDGVGIFVLPQKTWERLSGNRTLYYRALSVAQPGSWTNIKASTPDDELEEAPRILVSEVQTDRLNETAPRVLTLLSRENDSRSWDK